MSTSESSKKKLMLSLPTFSKATINDLMNELKNEKKEIISIPSDSTVLYAVNILFNNKILSAPVQDMVTKNYLGIIDMFDILRYLIKIYSTTGESDYVAFLEWWETTMKHLPVPLDEDTLPALEEKKDNYFLAPILRVLGRSPTGLTAVDSSLMISKDSLISQAISMLSSGLRRILVTDEKSNTVIAILSQFDLMLYLDKQLEKNNEKEKTLVKDLGIGESFKQSFPYYIIDTEQALQGYYLMNYYNISAIPVLDKNEKLVANLSLSDLKHLTIDNFVALTLPVMDYLQIYSPTSRIPPLKVNITTAEAPLTFKDLIHMITTNQVHRVWSVDNNDKLLGIISLTDILKLLDISL